MPARNPIRALPPLPKKAPAPRVRYRGRCGGCGYVARFDAFRYVDGTPASLRECRACGRAVRVGLAIVA